MLTLFGQRLTWRPTILICCESILILVAIVAASYVRLGEDALTMFAQGEGLWKALLIGGCCQLAFYYADLYDARNVSDRRQLAVGLLQSLGSASLLLAVIYFWFPSLMIGRGVFVIAAVLVIMVVSGWRVLFGWLSARVAPRERLLLIGTDQAAVELVRELFARRMELGIEIVGFIDPDPARVGAPVLNPGVIGTISDVPAIVSTRSVDRVVVSLADARGKLPMNTLLDMKLQGVSFDHLASVYEQFTGKIAVENLRPSWLIFSPGFRKTAMMMAGKRMVDVLVAGVGLILTAPIAVIVTAAIKFFSPGPVLYQQRRVGLNGTLFTIYKFRSMHQNAEAETGPVWAQKGDARITTIGRFLRRSRLDELPQLWNVLRGDMSLVGPRPERPEFVRMLTEQIPFYGQRHAVKPGVTGWAQVRYTYGASVEDAMEKLQFDLYYIKHMSLALDLCVIAETLKTMMVRPGS